MRNRTIAILAALALFAAPALAAPAKKGTHPGSAGNGATAPVSADPAPLPPARPSAAPVAPPASPAPAPAASEPVANVPGTVIAVPGASPIGSPTFVTVPPPAKPGGFINIGQIFGEIAAPYINGLVELLISLLVGYVALLYKRVTGKELDEKNREAVNVFLKNKASGLLAAGKVQLDGLKVKVDDAHLASEANDAMRKIPDAMAYFDLTPEKLEKKIVEMIPQTEAGAAIIAQAHAEAAPAAS